jgi:hypothetical protein
VGLADRRDVPPERAGLVVTGERRALVPQWQVSVVLIDGYSS